MGLIDIVAIINDILNRTNGYLKNENDIAKYPTLIYEKQLDKMIDICDFKFSILRNVVKENKNEIVEIYNNFEKIIQKHPEPNDKMKNLLEKFKDKIELI